MNLTPREKVIARVADHLVAHELDHPLRVAVDGVTAAGKSTFAEDVTAAVIQRGRPALHLSTDDFHHQRDHRHRRTDDSAAGYYEDAYDLDAVARLLLRPLGPDGDCHYQWRSHDLATDAVISEPPRTASSDSIVIIDGSFLQRPELTGLWDEVIYLDVDLDVARERGSRRDAELFGGSDLASQAFDTRYHAAAKLYLRDEVPAGRATIVIDNNDLERPRLRRIGGAEDSTAYLFSYGTLQQEGVQLSSFDRVLDGSPDNLPAHRTDWVEITDLDVIAASGSNRHPIVRPSADPADQVSGTVFTITTTELAAADDYEVSDYRRVRVILGSGLPAWVYLAAMPEISHA